MPERLGRIRLALPGVDWFSVSGSDQAQPSIT
jgi:hypothetical protein